MRILHIFDHSIPMHSGYTFRSRNLLLEQKALGWQPIALTTPRHVAGGPNPEVIDDLEFHRTPCPDPPFSNLPGVKEMTEIWATRTKLLQLASDLKPDILHAHSPVLNFWPAYWVGRKLGIPVAYEIRAFWEDAAVSHGTIVVDGPKFRLIRRMETAATRRADAVFVICQGLKQDLMLRGVPEGKITLIPNAVNPLDFTPITEKDPELLANMGLQERPIVGFIGSFYHYEGLHILLQAIDLLRVELPSIVALLVGGGPEEEKLKTQTRKLGLENHVKFIGRVPHEEVPRYYSLVDVLAYPRTSIRLTELVTPLKPLEAMAMKKLFVASNIGGHRELVEHEKTGFLFKADDPEALKTILLPLLRKDIDHSDVITNGRKFVETVRTWENSVANYSEPYERIISSGMID